MKISALVSLLGVAATTFLPGVAASEASSLRGQVTIPDEVDFLGLGINCDNWDRSMCAGTGGNTCFRVIENCGICQCTLDNTGDRCTQNSCRSGSGSGSSRNCRNINNRNTCRNTNGCIWEGSSSNGQCRLDTFDDDNYDDDDWNSNRSCRNRSRNSCDNNAPECAWISGECINNNFCGPLSWNQCQQPNNGCERATVNGVDFCRPDSSFLLKLFGFDPLASNDHDEEDEEVVEG